MGRHTIKTTASNNAGNHDSKEIKMWKTYYNKRNTVIYHVF